MNMIIHFFCGLATIAAFILAVFIPGRILEWIVGDHYDCFAETMCAGLLVYIYVTIAIAAIVGIAALGKYICGG